MRRPPVQDRLSQAIAELSPEARQLLELRLRKQRAQAPEAPKIERRSDPEERPVSFAQERLWFLEQWEPGTGVYNIPLTLRVEGKISIPALAASFEEIVRRHEVLRTVLSSSGGRARQELLSESPPFFTTVDLRSLPGPKLRGTARRLAASEGRRPFDLSRGPLLRVLVLRLSGEESWLLVNFHHLVADGWSLGVLLQELKTLYAAAREGTWRRGASPLPELAIQYADFAAWQRRWLTGERLTRQLEFWKKRLEGAPAELELIADDARRGSSSHLGALVTRRWPAELCDALKGVAQERNSTFFMVLLALYGALLGRFSGQRDLVVGSPVANRNPRETESLIGFFVNTLALRLELGKAGSFSDLVSQVRSMTLEAQDHQDLPFERLIAELRPERAPRRAPLFQVMLALQNAPLPAVELPGAKLMPQVVHNGTAKLDLVLMTFEEEGGLSLQMEYRCGLLEASAVERMLRHLQALARSAAASPDTPWDELSWLTADQKHQLVAEWNDTGRSLPAVACIHALFAEQAARYPDRVAVRYAEESLSYRVLDRRANRLARRLREAGVRRETRVGISMGRSAEMIVALLAILKSGGAYVPLDASYPQERLAFMIRDAGLAVVLFDEAGEHRLGSGLLAGMKCIRISRGDAGESPSPPPGGMTGEELAYCIYTSGSTGRPKGVAVSHRNVLRLVWDVSYADLGPQEVFLQMAPVSFDAATLEIWAPLLNGGCLAVAPEGGISLAELGSLLRRFQVTSLWLTAGLFHQMAASYPKELGSVRQVLSGGDVLSPIHVRRVLEEGSRLEVLINGYGPTEGTTFTSCHRMRVPPTARGSLPIGRPITNTTVVILDRRFRPVPIGVSGELCTGGLGVARGYLDRPGLTARQFVPDALGGVSGGRLYRTGDLARWSADGTIEFQGRMDHQVKVRGFRVELSEIEIVLGEHPALEKVVVVASEGGAGEKRLVAYAVAAGARPGVEALRSDLSSRLPDHMVPSAFVFLDALPLDPNGKVDRRALPAPEGERPDLEAEFEAPRSELEEDLAAVWRELLGVEKVGVYDDFFALGGHSLLATRLLARLREDLGIELSLRQLFEAPTLAGLARQVQEHRPERNVPLPPLEPVTREQPLPLSFAQERLWFLDRLEPGGSAYNIPLALALRGPLAHRDLERALQRLTHRHETLRIRLVEYQGRPLQEILPPSGRYLPEVDLRGLGGDRRRVELQRQMALEEARPFELNSERLWRALLLRLDEDEHVLIMNLHHVLGDGWSLGVLLRDLTALLEAERRSLSPTLPRLEVQYADFASWQRRWLLGSHLEALLSFWRSQLEATPGVLELPLDRPRGATKLRRGALWTRRLPRSLARGVHRLSSDGHTTPFMVLLAAFQTLLYRVTGQKAFAVGSPIAGRRFQGIEDLIGFFVNTLVLPAAIDPRRRFRDHLSDIRDMVLEAFAHQDLPFEKLVEELAPERSLNVSPLFQVMLTVQNAPMPEVAVPGLDLEVLLPGTTTAKFDLSWVISEADGALQVAVEYDRGLFDRSTVARLVGQFERLLAASAEARDTAIAVLPLLDPAERHQLVLEWNDVARPFPQETLLHGLFAERAAKCPEAMALVCEDEQLSYRDLDRRANQLAHHLVELGVGVDEPVALYLERSAEMVVALLGVLKAGAAYLPVDPSYPSSRVELMLEDSGASVVLTVTKLLAALPFRELQVVDLTAIREELDARPGHNPGRSPDPAAAAYVLYTSGSTGQPKAAVLSHRAICNHMLWMEASYPLTPDDVVLQKTPFSFDASVWEFWAPLLRGARLLLARPGGHQDSAYLVEVMETQGCTILQVVPTLLRMLLSEPGLERCPLKRVYCGGEELTVELRRRFFERMNDTELINVYGPTEATIHSASWLCSPSGDRFQVPIGRSIANGGSFVLDETGQSVGIGVTGEIFAAGAGLGRGYLGRPALSAERFVPHPFATRPGERLYRTGDLGRWRPDGSLVFLGRRDHQVKLRGFRIELGEIEAALKRISGAREAVVAVRDERLVAYWVKDERETLSEASLQAALRKVLPDYMVPAAFVALEELPLLPNGKLNRRALPAPGLQERHSSAGYVAPRDPLEEILAGIWMELLSTAPVGVDDNFFELGGHSLLAVRIISRLRESCHVDVPLRRFFELPSVAHLAEVVRELRDDPGAAEEPLRRVERGRPGELSAAQERFWFLARLDPESTAYNVPLAIRVTGRFDLAAFERALFEVERRHEVLRTVFPVHEGRTRSVITAAAVRRPARIDLSALASGLREETVRRLAAVHVRRPFDVVHGPLWHVLWVRLSEDEHVLLFSLHHIVTDGWSTGLLMSDLAACYESFVAAAPLPWAGEAELQYFDFAHHQRRWLASGRLVQQIEYWRRQLQGAASDILQLPSDRPRPAVQSHRGGQWLFELPPHLSEDLTVLSRRLGVTAFMVLLSAFQVFIGRYSGQRQVSVGTPTAGRRRRETEEMLGCFVNTLVLRVDLGGRPRAEDLLRRVRETTLGAFAHQDVPFEQLVEELDVPRSQSHTPLFQVFFAYQNTPLPELDMGELTWRPLPAETGQSRFDLTLEVEPSPGGLSCRFEYSLDLFEKTSVARMASHFRELVQSLTARPEQRITELAWLSPGARHQLVFEHNDTAAEIGGEGDVDQRFREQVRRSASSVALTHGERRLSYSALDSEVDRLARRLRALGIGPGAVVAVHLRRSPDLVIALLAVLRSGAAYLPLDPSYPNHRLRFMLEDSRAPLLISESALAESLAEVDVARFDMDNPGGWEESAEVTMPAGRALAYMIYTSGSTGQPKGVMVSHRNVVNFFHGMDGALGYDGEPGVWLAVTSVSFDISVLEILWSLTRGFEVVLVDEQGASAALAVRAAGPRLSRRPVGFSLFYFASADEEHNPDPYKLLLEGARFADRHGFEAVWTPERHFHDFGGLYPNPSVISAALATITQRVALRAGSVVLPLHHPVRVAEEWSVVDNLSRGRVGLSVASGWHANDFVFAPGAYTARKEAMVRDIDVVRRLWRGEPVALPGGVGEDVAVRIRPRPVQKELPVWLTAAGNPETFQIAGEIGTNVLTHLLGQELDDLATKIQLYRQAWREAGREGEGRVTLMLHTFVGEDMDVVRETVREPFTGYLRTSFGLLQGLARTLGHDPDAGPMSEEDTAAVLDHAFERYLRTSSLLGTVESCRGLVEQILGIGVDEIGCLIDFGVDADETLEALKHLDVLRRVSSEPAPAVAAGARSAEPADLLTLLKDGRATHFQCTPSMARMLMADPAGEGALKAGLRQLLVGGEALPDALAISLCRSVGVVRNMYGPTETTVWSATQRVRDGEVPVPIGRPIANTALHVLDGGLRPVPHSVAGELYIGGLGVVPGYHDRASLTSERFLPDPFSDSPGTRLYRTGDLVRRARDGRLSFLGRVDHQVKLHGYRIELGEIEASLGRHPEVRAAVVMMREDKPGDPRLVAYILGAAASAEETTGAPSVVYNGRLDLGEAREFLRRELPEYMLPVALVELDRWPLTPNGKVDRRALPAPPEKTGTQRQAVLPRTPMEELLAGLICEVLGVEEVGVEDDFFELGGHSLLAAQLFARLRDVLKIDLPLRLIFAAPTIAALAQHLEREQRDPEEERPPLRRVPRNVPHRLSLAQQRIWFLEQLQPGTATYVDRAAVRLDGPLDVGVLARSLGEIFRRHEVLRTRFLLADGEPFQQISEPRPVRLPIIDLSGLSEETRQRRIRRLAAVELQRPFDLTRDELLRFVLLRLGTDRHAILLTVHHIVWDGWSYGVFVYELSRLYESFSRGDAPGLEELEHQYLDVTHWQHEWLAGRRTEQLLAYWRRQLGGDLPVLQMPTDYPRPAVQTQNGRRLPFELPSELSVGLRELSRRQGVTLFMTLLAGFDALLYSYTGREDVVVGTDVANRGLVGMEKLIGFFVNQLVLRVDLSGDPAFLTVLDRARSVCLDAYTHQELPFNKLVDSMSSRRGLGHSPLFQVKLVLQNAPVPEYQVQDLSMSPLDFEWTTAKFDILVNVNDGEELTGSCEYNTDLFKASTIEQLVTDWLRLLDIVANRPEIKLSEVQRLVKKADRKEKEDRGPGPKRVVPRAKRRQVTIP